MSENEKKSDPSNDINLKVTKVKKTAKKKSFLALVASALGLVSSDANSAAAVPPPPPIGFPPAPIAPISPPPPAPPPVGPGPISPPMC